MYGTGKEETDRAVLHLRAGAPLLRLLPGAERHGGGDASDSRRPPRVCPE
jgi:hypothetical protein